MRSQVLGTAFFLVICLSWGCKSHQVQPEAVGNDAGAGAQIDVATQRLSQARKVPTTAPEKDPAGLRPRHEEPAEASPEPTVQPLPQQPGESVLAAADKRHDWPGVATDLSDSPPLYLGRMTVSPSPILRKPKYPTDIVHPLNEGHIIEVLAEEGPTVNYEGVRMAVMPARIGPYIGWVFKDYVQKVDAIPFDKDTLWAELKRAAGKDSGIPDSNCTPVIALMDLSPAPGEEALSYAIGAMGCDTVFGVFENSSSPRLLAVVSGERLQEARFIRQGAGPSLLVLHTHWQLTPRHSGEHHHFLGWSNGKFTELKTVASALFDTREMPARYETTQFAFPLSADGGRVYLQQHTTIRLIGRGGKEKIESLDIFFQWTGAGLEKVAAPAEAVEFPAAMPSIEHHNAEVVQ